MYVVTNLEKTEILIGVENESNETLYELMVTLDSKTLFEVRVLNFETKDDKYLNGVLKYLEKYNGLDLSTVECIHIKDLYEHLATITTKES